MSIELGIEKVELVFENCETLVVPAWYIGEFCLKDIRTEIARQAMNHIGKMQTAYGVLIEISKLFDGTFRGFGEPDDVLTNFKRIEKWGDITSIAVYYERCFADEPEQFDSFFVDYNEPESEAGMLGARNEDQHVVYDKCGNLILYIGKDKDLKELADSLAERDPEEIEFTHEMYDIGAPFEPAHKFSEAFPKNDDKVWVANKDESEGAFAIWCQHAYDETMKQPLNAKSMAGGLAAQVKRSHYALLAALTWTGEEEVKEPYSWQKMRFDADPIIPIEEI